MSDSNSQNNLIGEIGRVESVSNEICFASGLESAGLNNVVEFSAGEKGLVLGYTQEEVQIVILGNYHNIKKGDLVKIANDSFKISVSPALLGRIIDPLGNPLDGKGKIEQGTERYIDSQAKGISERNFITQPLSTGFLIIDSQIPIGVGQRELFVGDKKIGKGEVGVAIIANQTRTNSGIISIYVGIDHQTPAIKRRIQQLKDADALKNTIVIAGRASDSASMNYLAPMTAVTIAEVLAAEGKDVLVVFDNLTRHAKVYRQLSLLLNRAPGRDAYPGDVFYLHSRLLERCGRFSDNSGGGSITAIPIVGIQGEEITDYITTNLMSITDGHILFRTALANQGIRPAIDSGFSVSRIGGRAQPKVLRQLSDQLRMLIVNYHEVEKYVAFGTELQADTLEMIELGKRVYQFFKQDTTELFSLDEEIALIYFLTSKLVLGWEVDQMLTLRKQFLEFSREEAARAKLQTFVNAEKLEDIEPSLKDLLTEFTNRPETIKQIEKKQASPAEQETIIDLLKDNTAKGQGAPNNADVNKDKNALTGEDSKTTQNH